MSDAPLADVTTRGRARLTPGALLERHGPDWWLFWDRDADRSYVVLELRAGRTRCITYRGLVVPACCEGSK